MEQYSFAKLLVLSLTSIFLVLGCTPPDELCSSAKTANDPNCRGQSDLGVNSQLLEIKFTDTKFFDQNTGLWVVISKADIEAAKIESTIPLYSNTTAKPASEAVLSAASADTQHASSITTTKNEVPYIRIEAKPGVTYSYRYRKYDSLGALKYEKLGTLSKSGEHAYIPMVNDFLDNQLYTTGTAVGTQHKHLFTITATSGSKTGLAKEVQAVTTTTVQNTEYLAIFGDTMNLLTLDNRWRYYRTAPTFGAVNTNLDYLILRDKAVAGEMTDLDVRVTFKDDFKIEIEQTLFEEVPFDLPSFKTTGVPVAFRGHTFYTNTITLNSIDDFKHKLFLDDLQMTETSRKVYTVNSFTAGKRFDIKFNIDLTQQSSYSGDPNSKGFHYPLQPVCKADKGQNFTPWVDEINRDNLKAQTPSLFNAICHLDQSANVTIDPANNPTNVALADTWFNFFSYAPYRPEKKELGHLFGIRSVKFRVTACYKIEVKATAAVTWNKRSQGNSNCGDTASTADWLIVSTEKSYTIFDNLSQYDTVPGLRSLIETFRSAPTVSKPNMKMNNEKLSGNSIRHLY